jgi:hypothetical protein
MKSCKFNFFSSVGKRTSECCTVAETDAGIESDEARDPYRTAPRPLAFSQQTPHPLRATPPADDEKQQQSTGCARQQSQHRIPGQAPQQEQMQHQELQKEKDRHPVHVPQLPRQARVRHRDPTGGSWMASAARICAVSRRDKKEVAGSVAVGSVKGRRTLSPYRISKGARPVGPPAQDPEEAAHRQNQREERNPRRYSPAGTPS